VDEAQLEGHSLISFSISLLRPIENRRLVEINPLGGWGIYRACCFRHERDLRKQINANRPAHPGIAVKPFPIRIVVGAVVRSLIRDGSHARSLDQHVPGPHIRSRSGREAVLLEVGSRPPGRGHLLPGRSRHRRSRPIVVLVAIVVSSASMRLRRTSASASLVPSTSSVASCAGALVLSAAHKGIVGAERLAQLCERECEREFLELQIDRRARVQAFDHQWKAAALMRGHEPDETRFPGPTRRSCRMLGGYGLANLAAPGHLRTCAGAAN
jgi:hypothetical protein